MLRDMIAEDHLPDYDMAEEPGDILRFTRRALVVLPGEGPLPPLAADTLETARALTPGWDVHALEADWRGVWVASGRPKLRAPDAAFLGYVRARARG